MTVALDGSEIETASGTFVSLTDPQPRDINVCDIAHALSHLCRYVGHSRRFYSVAEHVVLVADRLVRQGYPPDICLAGLHHDDAEAYLGDVARPLKRIMGGRYEELTAGIDGAVWDAVACLGDLPPLWASDAIYSDAVKRADDWALAFEARQLMPSRGAGWAALDPDVRLDGVSWHGGARPEFARRLYLRRHAQLTDEALKRQGQP